MPDQNPLAGLNAAELSALAKAQSAGVTIINKDGTQSDITKTTPPAADAAAAANLAAAAATKAAAASADVDPKSAAAAAAAALTNKPTRPDHVPEKFWDAATGAVNTEALLKSYGELEKTRSKPAESNETRPAEMGAQPDAAAVAAAAAAAEAAKTATPDPAKAAAEASAARDAAAVQASAEMAKDGKISEATYAALDKVGYPRPVVDQYVAGQQAQAQLILQGIHAAAGGTDAYAKMVQWGSTSYTAAEQTAFNKAIHSGDAGTAQQAVNGLKARYDADFGKAPVVRVDGGNGATGTGTAFQSQAELTKAMSDPRYKGGDAAYHREVQARMQASLRANIDIGIRIQK